MTMHKQPYTFVPVVLPEGDDGLYDVTFHDGTKDQTLSGEIRCTINALTPLIVGHYRYDYSDIENAQIPLPEPWNLHSNKAVLEPLFINPKNPKDINSSLNKKRVVIPGASIKGMLRHSIGAMFGAPMERVQEQYYSYRPNLVIQMKGKFECREAIVIKHSEEEQSLKVKVLSCGNRSALFINSSVFNSFRAKPCHLTDILKSGDLRVMNLEQQLKNGKNQYRIAENESPLNNNTDYQLIKYCSGIDGVGEVAKIGPQKRVKDDVAVLMPTNMIDSAYIKDIPPEIYQQFIKTKAELSDDKYGHIARNKDVKEYGDNIKKVHLEENQLIYVEINTETDEIVSFGTNFRYRWRYADSVKTIQDLDTREQEQSRERAILSKLENEQVNNEINKLSAVRQFFGYVDSGEEGKDGELNLGIGDKKDYARLAGRISINMALEKPKHNSLKDRFITRETCEDETRFTIPLNTLGQPNASAVEHYVQQSEVVDTGAVNTYGDLPGLEQEYEPSELNGRKFYRHQANAEKSQKPYLAIKQDDINSQHGTLARYISTPGSQFQFTLRFKDMQLWELGAILLALNPNYLENTNNSLSFKQQKPSTAIPDNVKYAQKLGYGRPLGLGSINIHADEINCFDITELRHKEQPVELFVQEAIESFLNLAKERNLPVNKWLQVMRYEGTDKDDIKYPTKTERKQGKEETTIYNYHTAIRREHAKQRRGEYPTNSKNKYGDLIKP